MRLPFLKKQTALSSISKIWTFIVWSFYGFGISKSEKIVKEYNPQDKQLLKLTNEFYAKKTFWDWLQLLIIPFSITVMGLWFTFQQNSTNSQVSAEQQQEVALGTYISDISDLILNKNLETTTPSSPLAAIARTKTLVVLNGLDYKLDPRLSPKRKSIVIHFLLETSLIQARSPIVELQGADLKNADFTHETISGINLRNVTLTNANLADTDLHFTDLKNAKLINAILNGANLTCTDLLGADLTNTDFTNVDLRNTRIESVIGMQLAKFNFSTIFTPEQVKTYPFVRGKAKIEPLSKTKYINCKYLSS